MDGVERWEPNQEGRTPTLKSSTLKPTQEVIKTGRNPDEEAITPTHVAPTLIGHLAAPIQEGVNAGEQCENHPENIFRNADVVAILNLETRQVVVSASGQCTHSCYCMDNSSLFANVRLTSTTSL